MCKFLTHYIYIKYYYHNIYWSETPVRPPAIKNATLFTRTYLGTYTCNQKCNAVYPDVPGDLHL